MKKVILVVLFVICLLIFSGCEETQETKIRKAEYVMNIFLSAIRENKQNIINSYLPDDRKLETSNFISNYPYLDNIFGKVNYWNFNREKTRISNNNIYFTISIYYQIHNRRRYRVYVFELKPHNGQWLVNNGKEVEEGEYDGRGSFPSSKGEIENFDGAFIINKKIIFLLIIICSFLVILFIIRKRR